VSEEFKPINDAGRRELQRRKFQFGGIANVIDSLSTAFQLSLSAGAGFAQTTNRKSGL
jgi:hypothetical protein